MTVFEKLKNMNDAEIQSWLRKIGQKNAGPLGIALSGADDDIKKYVLRNMSLYAAEILKKEIEKNKKMNISEKTIALNAVMLEELM
jgi:flagellar motor switch protein FliG